MKIKLLLLIIFVGLTFTLRVQKNEYATVRISDSLKENANAIVRLNQIDITFPSQRFMTFNTKRVTTVLNEKGFSTIDAIENYNTKKTVRDIEPSVYDSFGNEIKRKDFKD